VRQAQLVGWPVPSPGTTREVNTTHFRGRTRSTTTGSDAGSLVTSAARLRWRAPELALLLADQASAAASEAGAESARLRAEVLAVFACNQLGRGAMAGDRALRALRAAQRAGQEATERLIRVELAACAADASAPAVGLAVLRPVFSRMPQATPTARAAAMVTAADCAARLGGGSDVAELLTHADQLYDTSRAVEPDAVLLRRGLVHARLAAYHRRVGDHGKAESTARAGLALVDELSDGELDTGQVSGALTSELVFALLDGGRAAEAVVAAQPVLRRPARPAGAAAACWLRIGLVSRVHLPAGRHALARRLLGDAAADAERNQLDVALTECRLLQAQLHETCAEVGEALQSVRAAHTADRRWRDTAAELRTLLAGEFGLSPPAAELRAELAAMLASSRAIGGSPARPARAADRMSRSRHAAPTPLPIVHPTTGSAPAATRPQEPPPVQAPSAEPWPSPEPAAGRRRLSPEPATGGPAHAELPAWWADDADGAELVATDHGSRSRPPMGAGPVPAVGAEVGVEAGPLAAVDAAAESVVGPESRGVAVTGIPESGDPGILRPAEVTAPEMVAEPGKAPELRKAPEPERTAEPRTAEPGWATEPGKAPESAVASGVPAAPGEPGEPEKAETPEKTEGQPGKADHHAADGGDQRPLRELLGANGYDRGSGRHRSDVAMADLLAEALMAYQNGRRSRLAAAAGSMSLEPRHDQPPPPPQPKTRLIDLPREQVWREPGSDEPGL